MEILKDSEFWVAVGFVVVIGIFLYKRLPAFVGAALDARAAGDLLFELCNSLFVGFVAREERRLAELKREMARQIRVVFAGLTPRESGR